MGGGQFPNCLPPNDSLQPPPSCEVQKVKLWLAVPASDKVSKAGRSWEERAGIGQPRECLTQPPGQLPSVARGERLSPFVRQTQEREKVTEQRSWLLPPSCGRTKQKRILGDRDELITAPWC